MPTASRPWSRDERLLVLNLYFRIPFGRQHQRAPEAVELARALDRTPSSVAMKLGNFTAVDPEERARGVKGLAGASRADRLLWTEFHDHWESMAAESERLWVERVEHGSAAFLPVAAGEAVFQGLTESTRPVSVRLAQGFFRKAVRAAYGDKCGVTGISVPELLIASHIVPWAEDEENRARPANGILLSSLNDAAFDRHLVSFDEEFKLVVGKRLRDHFTNSVVRESFAPFEGRPLRIPDRHAPDPSLMERHRARFTALGA
jgi:putative restriction endonuclease